MRSKDIIADGGTSYAYASDWQWNSSRLGRSARRVVVTSTGVKRGRFTSSPKDGVEISFVGNDGLPTGITDVVRAAEIRQLWSEYKAELDERRKLIEERNARQRAQQDEIRARLDEIFAMIPNATRPVWADGSVPSGKLSPIELAELLRAAYDAGWDAAVEDF